ncbi:sulfite exporter TauE/SafE family protein [Comamonas sp. UBA7528]|jgi:sulfite exporter TauE/SafE|uniref:sulfite exporter TauE/SafE family protein n=1 Tax=Comamonas sp. UBA7528 TaxID=1946391 RepID=UPI0025BC636B|nr:sulfite exporter TauE/SafE family protein [Comamonas sp. UBA7528]
MWLSLLGTAFFMGLVGGPHCLAMCAAPCAAIVSPLRTGGRVVSIQQEGASAQPMEAANAGRWLGFHAGRLMGYAALGGVAAYAMETVAWFSDRTSALHPLWVLLHLAALAWGLMLLLQARQPQWVESGGRKLWGKVQHGVRGPGGTWVAGSLWAFLPCGLLYSAVMVAALAGGVWQGAASMVAFGVGGGLWLALGPWLWRRISRLQQWREAWGLRTAGALLAGVSLWALWMDMVHVPSQWCR